jgi:hypothetical protein
MGRAWPASSPFLKQNFQSTIILVAASTLIIVATAIVLYRKRSQTPKPEAFWT